MFEYVASEFVTTDMGGQLEFDASEWTQNRSVSSNALSVMTLPGFL